MVPCPHFLLGIKPSSMNNKRILESKMAEHRNSDRQEKIWYNCNNMVSVLENIVTASVPYFGGDSVTGTDIRA